MSFTSTLKRALGFQSAIDDEDDEFDTTLPTYAVGEQHAEDKPVVSPRPSRVVNPFAVIDTSALNDPANRPTGQPAMTDESLPGDLFDELISLFNSIQPDFVAKCLSTEEQRRYIYRSLSEGLKRRMDAVNRQNAQQPDDGERARMQQELVRLREDVKQVEQLRTRLQEASLSAQRQKQALSNRAVDLQNRVDQLEAELEKMHDEAALLAAKRPEPAQEQPDLQPEVDRLTAQCASLTAEAEALRNKLKLANDERESLRQTIETNLYNQAHSESSLRKEIKRLEKALADKPKSKGRKRKISAIDESNQSTDWFDSTPPPGMGKVEMPDNPDFGYQAPQRKKQNDNDAQMLLW